VAGESTRVLAGLQPAIIASGHGSVMAGADLAESPRTLAKCSRMSSSAKPVMPRGCGSGRREQGLRCDAAHVRGLSARLARRGQRACRGRSLPRSGPQRSPRRRGASRSRVSISMRVTEPPSFLHVVTRWSAATRRSRTAFLPARIRPAKWWLLVPARTPPTDSENPGWCRHVHAHPPAHVRRRVGLAVHARA